MASEITHIVLAKQIKDKFYPQLDPAPFYVGATFPDIRYISPLTRSQTHHFNYSTSDPFFLGCLVHVQIDHLRIKFLDQHHLYQLFPKLKFPGTSLKILEDRLLYPQFKSWSQIISFYQQIFPQQKSILNHPPTIRRWHQLLIDYFSRPPDDQSMLTFSQVLGVDLATINSWARLIPQIKKNPDIIKITTDFHRQLPQFYQNQLQS